MNQLPRWIKYVLYLTADFISLCLIGLFIFVDRDLSLNILSTHMLFLLSYVLLQMSVFFIAGIYQVITTHFSMFDSIKFGLVAIGLNLLFFLGLTVFSIPFSLLEFTFVLIAEPSILITIRVGRRLLPIVLGFRSPHRKDAKRTLIIGAGSAGKLVIDEIRNNQGLQAIPIVVVDDNKEKQKRRFLNLPVVGPVSDVSKFIKAYRIDQVIIGVGSISRVRLFEILRYMEKDQVKIRRLPLMEELEKDGQQMKVKDVDVNELLGRDVVPLINDEIKGFIKDQVVMITGAGGSIGSELTRQIFTYQPKALILLDIYENGVYDVQQELAKSNKKLTNKIPVHVQIGSTYNRERMEEIFKQFQPQLVFHAAAYKHVPLMEDSPQEAIRTNILGTYNIASLSMQYRVKKMVLVSTDKAVRSTNVMGATKYYAETIIRHFAKQASGTSYAAVRFGNVLASNGSVIPLFKKQIESGGPVTVTDKYITRYFMTIPEAVGLILQSGVYAKDGEIFVLDMGKPVKIIDLAEKMIRQSGFIPYEEIQIEFTGLRPGEKMYEELLLDPKTTIKTNNNKIFIDRNNFVSFNQDSYELLLKHTMNNDHGVVDVLFKQLKLRG